MQRIIQPDWYQRIDAKIKPDVEYYRKELIDLPRNNLSEILSNPSELSFLAKRPEGILFTNSNPTNSETPFSTYKILYGINIQREDETSQSIFETLATFKINRTNKLELSLNNLMSGFERDVPEFIRTGAEELASRLHVQRYNWESTGLDEIFQIPEVIMHNGKLVGIKLNHQTRPHMITDSMTLQYNPNIATPENSETLHRLQAYLEMQNVQVKIPEPYFQVEPSGRLMTMVKSILNVFQHRMTVKHLSQYILDVDKKLIGVAYTQF